jgi:hypothetical protein
LSNLTAGQLAALTSGQPVRQVWSIKAPVLADHSAYTTTVIDDGLFSSSATPLRRIVKAGSRTHSVWNPRLMSNDRPNAVRYSIEVSNSDGYFHRKVGSAWNPLGIYDAAPSECFLLHSIYVWDESADAWSPIVHMDFVGQIIDVSYLGAASAVGTGSLSAAPNVATITSEQLGVISCLKRVFTVDDADISRLNQTGTTTVGYFSGT